MPGKPDLHGRRPPFANTPETYNHLTRDPPAVKLRVCWPACPCGIISPITKRLLGFAFAWLTFRFALGLIDALTGQVETAGAPLLTSLLLAASCIVLSLVPRFNGDHSHSPSVPSAPQPGGVGMFSPHAPMRRRPTLHAYASYITLPVLMALASCSTPAYAWQPDPNVLSRVDAIVSATLIDAGVAKQRLHPGEPYVTLQPYVRARVSNWIVGPASGIELYASLPGDYAGPVLDSLRSWQSYGNTSILIYLNHTRDGWTVTTAGGLTTGVEQLPPREASTRAAMIASVLRSISVDSLAARAPIAILATLIWPPPIGAGLIHGPGLFYFHVDSTIYGATPETIAVTTSRNSQVRQGRALLLLSRDAQGTFAPIRDGLGYLRLRSGHVHSDPRSLADIVRSIAINGAHRPGD